MQLIMVFTREVIIIVTVWVIKEPFYLSYSQITPINNSTEISRRFIFSKYLLREISSIIKAPYYYIVPGTKWCGDGNIAKHESDLGIFSFTDECCKQHDNCGDSIIAGEYFNSLHNDGSFTRSSCECDDRFYDCLKLVSTPISHKIGVKYFNILAPPCFIFDHPIKRCIKSGGIYKRRCLKYEFDKSSPKIFQWRDSKLFTIL